MPEQPQVISPEKKQVTVARESQGILAMISKAQADPSVDVAKLERLFDLYERARKRDAEHAYNEAVARVTAAMPRITKTKSVAYDLEKGKPEKGQKEAFKYAPLEKIDQIVAPLLKDNNLRVSYTTKFRDGGGAIVVGKLTHVDGHSEECEMPLPLDTSGGKNNIQGMGSTFSYGMRYTLCGMLNIVVIGADDNAMSSSTIPEEKVKELEDRLKKCGADKEKFLEFMEVKEVKEITLPKLSKAENMIKAKERAQAKKKPTN